LKFLVNSLNFISDILKQKINKLEDIVQHSSMNEEHLASLFNIKSLLDDLKEENMIQPEIDRYFSKK
jgi:hypothetical protein